MTRISERIRRLPHWVTDGGLALMVAAADVGETAPLWRDGDAGWAIPLLVAAALPLALRRRAPVTTLFVVGLATAALVLAGMDGTMLGVAISTYTVAAYSSRRWSIAALVLVLAGSAVVVLIERELHYFPEAASLFGMGWALGALQRSRERERDERARLAVAEERGRIARELHDVLAHSMSVVVVQAGGAARVLGSNPDRAAHALDEIQRVGRESLREMRQLLGVLKPAAGREPQHGIGRLDELLDRFRETDLAVELVVDGAPQPLPPAVDLSAYRIVQEALTNVLKHAGAAPARVTLRYAPDRLAIEIIDQGSAGSNGSHGGDGRGLVGIRERVAMLGGAISLGPVSGGGYRLACTLPLERE